jgi:hypothetical protein
VRGEAAQVDHRLRDAEAEPDRQCLHMPADRLRLAFVTAPPQLENGRAVTKVRGAGRTGETEHEPG